MQLCLFLLSCVTVTSWQISARHLALGATPDQITVSWIIYDGKESVLVNADTYVWYGLSPDELDNQGFPNTTRYTTRTVPRNSSDFVDYTSGLIHHCRLHALKPSTKYYYVISSLGSSEFDRTEVFSFTTMPSIGGKDEYFAFATMGDLGQTTDSAKTISRVDEDDDIKFIMHAGDMAYADCDQKRWETYFDHIEPLAASTPWMVVAGNHEIEPNNLTGHIMDPYKHLFAMPQVQRGEDTTQYFQDISKDGFDCTPSAFTGSFDYGNSFYSLRAGSGHFLFLNSYTNTGDGSAQKQWLIKELAKVDREVTPWLIAMWHSPWYNSNAAHQGEFNTIAMRASMEALLVEAGVNIVFSGHVHAYERSHPVAFGKRNKDSGVVYVGIGDGGNREGHSNAYLQRPAWNAYRNGTSFGHGKVTLFNRTHAMWQWLSNDALGHNLWGEEDATVIVNHHA